MNERDDDFRVVEKRIQGSTWARWFGVMVLARRGAGPTTLAAWCHQRVKVLSALPAEEKAKLRLGRDDWYLSLIHI